jgi:hypothetical protein
LFRPAHSSERSTVSPLFRPQYCQQFCNVRLGCQWSLSRIVLNTTDANGLDLDSVSRLPYFRDYLTGTPCRPCPCPCIHQFLLFAPCSVYSLQQSISFYCSPHVLCTVYNNPSVSTVRPMFSVQSTTIHQFLLFAPYSVYSLKQSISFYCSPHVLCTVYNNPSVSTVRPIFCVQSTTIHQFLLFAPCSLYSLQ